MQLHYHCFLNHTGYSIAAQEYILALKSVRPDLNIKIHPQNAHFTGIGINRNKIFRAMIDTPDIDNQIHIYHTTPARYRKNSKYKSICVCLFESISPPVHWVNSMNQMDHIIVASHFNKNSFESSGVTKPITVIPHCFDTNMFNKNISPQGRYGLKTFLSIGTFKKRKNWEGLIKGFYNAFSLQDNVCLLAKTDQPGQLEALVKNIKKNHEWRAKNTAPIFIESKNVCQFEDIPKFMAKGDFFVTVSRGEGFSLGGFHAMALGMPIITTKYGGCLEYAKDNYCLQINPSGYQTEPIMDGIPQFKNCIWPIFKTEDISQKMKEIMSFPVEKTTAAYNFIHKNFNYETIGHKIMDTINHV